MKIKRRESRETAFALIFEWGFRTEESLSDIIAQAEIGRGITVDNFAYELAEKTIESCDALDKTIDQYSKSWKLNRIPRVTLAVLRMSFCELVMFPDIPVGATINEAVELVKKYASEEDAAYLNGILGQYERDRTMDKPDETEAAKADAIALQEEVVLDSAIKASERAAVEASIIHEDSE